MTDIREKQPHVVIALPGAVHVIAVADLRALANGEKFLGDKDQMIQVVCRGLVDLIEGCKV